MASTSAEAIHDDRRPSVASSSCSEALAIAHYKKKLFYRRLKVIVIGLLALSLLLMGCLLGLVLPATLETSPKRLLLNGTHRETPSAKMGDLHDDTVNFIDMNSPDLNQSVMHMRGIWFPFRYDLEDDVPPSNVTPTSAESTSANQIPTSTDTPTEIKAKYDFHKYWIVHWKDHLENELQKSQQYNNTSEGDPSSANITATPSTVEARKPTTPSRAPKSPTTTQVIKSNVRQVTSYPQMPGSNNTTPDGIRIRPVTTEAS